MSLYLDASCLVAMIAEEASAPGVFDTIQALGNTPIISDLCRAESSAALARLVRTGRRTATVVEGLYERLDRWTLLAADATTVEARDIAHATELVRRLDLALRTPDAIHIAATRRLGATLLTLDKGMATAADALGVPHINPAEAHARAARKTE